MLRLVQKQLSLPTDVYKQCRFRFQMTYIYIYPITDINKVKQMQRTGTEAIRTQLQPSKPKREITKIANSQNTKITYGQPSDHLFPKRWPLSNRNQTKIK